jgi:rod shape-determining protein MreD
MKLWAKAGIIIVALSIELLLANLLGINTVKPDLILIVVICLSFISGPEEGVMAGFVGGLLKDVFSVHILGINALVKTVIGYVSGSIKEKIFYQHLLWLVTIATFVFTMINNLLIYFLLSALYPNYDFAYILKGFIFMQALINTIFAPFIFAVIRKLFSYLNRWS